MSLLFYKFLHLLSLFLLFLGLGLSLHPPSENQALKKLGSKFHGIALLLILISGFGMLAKLGNGSPLPGWAAAKIGLWVLIGVSMVFIKRQILKASFILASLLIIGALATYLALYQPL